MSYIDRYAYYLDQLQDDILKQQNSKKRPFFAFTSNYDVVLKWDAEVFNRILDEYLKEEPAAQAGEYIHTMQDFARIAAYCAMTGMGMSIDVMEISVCHYLLEHFEKESALGGTAAQGAAALATIGLPMAIQLTDKSRETCEMLNMSDMRVVSEDALIPVMEGASDEKPVYHIILQFSKGDVIYVRGEEKVIPVSNRLICFYDKIQKIVPIDRDFLEYVPKHTDEITSLLISGFDAILDLNTIMERAEEIHRMLEKVRAVSEELPVYLEGAFYMNSEIKKYLFQTLGVHTSIIGTNEEELEDLCRRTENTIDLEDMSSILHALEFMQNRYGAKGIVLHTKDYAMFYGEKPNGIDVEKGLTIGNLMAGTRARVGRYGTMEDLRQSLQLPLSSFGMKFYEILQNMECSQDVCLVPSRYMENPVYTIGLGDTFVGGMHTCFL